MSKEYNLITNETYETVKGAIPYNLTNDYMFKATLQECNKSLLGIVSALLRVDPSSLVVSVANPMVLGRNLANKDFFLDVRVIVNNFKHMNLEMQVSNEGNWLERSVSYTSRMFDSLIAGHDYKEVISVHHVGFINFNLFSDDNRFYETFALTNSDNNRIYTNKFLVSVVNLLQINEATAEDRLFKLDQWAKLITANTWEELKELAKEDSYMEATARTLFNLSQDFDTMENARRREMYYADLKRRDDTIAEQEARIANLEAENARIADLEAEIAKLHAMLS